MPATSRADSFEDAVRAFARKVAPHIHGGAVVVDKHNISSLNETEFLNLGATFQDELRHLGTRILQSNADSRIILTLSRNLSGYLGIAQVYQGESSETIIKSLGSSASDDTVGISPDLTLQQELILSLDQPILDVVFSPIDPKRIEILGPREIISYQRQGDRWSSDSTLRFPRNAPVERELRGYLRIGLDDMSAVFPTEICTLSIHDGDQCRPNRKHVGLSTVPDEILESKKTPPWLSATQFESEGHTRLLISASDGLLYLFDEGSEPVATFSKFGSEITSFRSGCGSGWQILVTGKGDWATVDTVQAVEFHDNRLSRVAQPSQFSGPVIVLRVGNRDSELRPASAVAVVHNLKTGRYEAYRLSIACPN